MYIDIHALLNVPPSNINRDDTGSPKTAIYGGALRARVSSQAWKRAMRKLFPELLPEGSLGVRTKKAVSLLANCIAAKREDLAEYAEKLAVAMLGAAGLKVVSSKRSGEDEGSMVTEYLVFIAEAELDALADIAIAWADDGADLSKKTLSALSGVKKQVSAAFHGVQAVDIALFGRMLANAPDLNTDASAQVAHAISVDRISQEYDYFTAVDDCAPEDNAGAGMIGTVGFNSSTLYRYATVNLDSLYGQLGSAEAAAAGVSAFVEAFVRSMPTGKQNTFANRTLPYAVVVELRDDQPINAVSAFELPVRATEGESVSEVALKRLVARLKGIDETYGMSPLKAWSVCVDGGAPDAEIIGERTSLPGLVKGVRDEALGVLASKEE